MAANFLERYKAGEVTLADMAKGKSRLGKALQREGVPPSPELKRVLDLPWYEWDRDPEIIELVKVLTAALRKPGGKQELLPIQAAALKAISECDGAFLDMSMGVGKTHIAYLTPQILEAERPVLIVPNGLKSKTERHFAEIAKHWQQPYRVVLVDDLVKGRARPRRAGELLYVVVGYNDLGRVEYASILDELDPDALVSDEGFKLANLPSDDEHGAGVTKRVRRHLSKHPDCAFVVMGGNLAEDRPIMQFHHLLSWAIGSKMPLPVASKDALIWARALDVKQHLTTRMELGALKVFGSYTKKPPASVDDVELPEARQGFYNRMWATPGVIHSKDPGVAASLRLSELTDLPNPCAQQIADAWAGRAPNGNEYSSDQAAQLGKQLECGFWYELDPPPPREWLDANRDFRNLVSLMLGQQDDEMDTAHQVEQFLAKNPHGMNIDAFRNWMAIKDMYRPQRLTRWLSFKVIDALVETAQPETILWTLYQAPGELMKTRHKLRYFHQGGLDATGQLIDDAKGETIVASISACAMGHNMQHAYYRNRVLTLPGFLLNEQVIGRTHRQEQPEGTVYVEYAAHTARAKAKLAAYRQQALEGSQGSRMSLGDWV